MAFKRFRQQLFIRLGCLFVCMSGVALLIASTELIVAPAILGVITVAVAWNIARFVQHTNNKLTHFLQSMRSADFSQHPDMADLGQDFKELGQAMNAYMERMRDSRVVQEKTLRYLQAVVDHVPVPLMALAPQGTLDFLNNAARRFFAPHVLTRVEDLDRFGPDLRKTMAHMRVGERQLVKLINDSVTIRSAISATEIVVDSVPIRLIALQNISSELEETELEAWQQLVQVLTHEVMNSITPVTSLAQTAAELLKDGKHDPETLADVKNAVDTVARRANALTRFVQSYRQLSRLPQPEQQRLLVSDLFKRLDTLIGAEWRERNLTMDMKVTPPGLTVNADPEQLEQILINLAQNASEALDGRVCAKVWLTGSLNHQGRVIIEISDNGPSVPPELRERIFVPFFTTKHTGSGIGLALTRQVMIAHKGSISVREREGGGAIFTLAF